MTVFLALDTRSFSSQLSGLLFLFRCLLCLDILGSLSQSVSYTL